MNRPSLLLACLILGACSAPSSGPYEPVQESSRDPERARELTRQAMQVLHDDPARAEELLREALTADLFHGPAHNDLGILYLHQSRLYEAANEFEWARKLLPGHPDPRLNLGITLERAGHVDRAIDSYKSAIEVYPDHVPTLQALSRLLLLEGKKSEDLASMIAQVALRGETQEWRDWAREQQIRLGR